MPGGTKAWPSVCILASGVMLAGVAEVVAVVAAGQRRAGGRLDGDDARLGAAAQACAEEREGDAGEVGAAADAADDHVRVGARPSPAARSPPGRSIVWCSSTWLSTRPSAYLVSSRVRGDPRRPRRSRCRGCRAGRGPRPGSRGRRGLRRTGTARTSRPRSPSSRAGTASGRRTPAPCRPCTRGRTACRRRPARSPTGRRRSRWRARLTPSCLL